MKKIITLAIGAAIALSACTPDLMLAGTKPARLSSRDVAQIKSAMTKDMFDPESARFRNIRGYTATFQDGHTELRACYEVNGKNRMGGYVGYEKRGAQKVNGVWESKYTCHL